MSKEVEKSFDKPTRYFLDTEFIERPGSIQLIFIGLAHEYESIKSYYAVNKEFNLNAVWKDEWLRDNVLFPIWADLKSKTDPYHVRKVESFDKSSLRRLIKWHGKTIKEIKLDLWVRIRSNPEFCGYYADYDRVVFCWIWGRMIDLPGEYPKYCIDLKQMMYERGLDKEWKRKVCPDPSTEHNALVDAEWNRKLYNAIIEEDKNQKP